MRNSSRPSKIKRRRRARTFGLAAIGLAVTMSAPAFSHESGPQEQTATPPSQNHPATAPLPFDFGGPFALIDHAGNPRTDMDFRGAFMLVFFGYTQCKSICPVGLRRMARALEILGPDGARIQPLMITVDPDNDTPEAMRAYVGTIHPRLIGLTGAREQVRKAARAYNVESRLVGSDPGGAPIFAHGSYFFLMAPDGAFATLLPPTIGEEDLARLLSKYLRQHPQ
ncbi:MAG: SCO family protein [Rhodospirillaceae bacterium]|jgi:protein SCO1|nr:SCO family protein [Rhodospirillaceae bacterium]MBT5665595.1 SCO family protein [Rhodospirillaceae bacterium]